MEKQKIFPVATIRNKQSKAKKCLYFFQSATTKRIWALYNQFQIQPVAFFIFNKKINKQLVLNKNKEINVKSVYLFICKVIISV